MREIEFKDLRVQWQLKTSKILLKLLQKAEYLIIIKGIHLFVYPSVYLSILPWYLLPSALSKRNKLKKNKSYMSCPRGIHFISPFFSPILELVQVTHEAWVKAELYRGLAHELSPLISLSPWDNGLSSGLFLHTSRPDGKGGNVVIVLQCLHNQWNIIRTISSI